MGAGGSLSTWTLTAQGWSIFVVMKCWSGVGMGPRVCEDTEGWFFARREGSGLRGGRFANRPYGSLSTWALTAQSWSIFVVIQCGAGVGDGFPHARGQRRGGRPRGTALRRCRRGGGYMWVGAVMPMRVRQRWRATRAAAVSLRRAAVSSWSAGSLERTRQFS